MLNFLVNPGKNKKPSSVEKISASQLSRIDEICEEIKKGDQNYSEKTVRTNGAPGKCKRLIKEGVTPETLFAKLGESLIEQKEYYIKTFLPALKKEIIQSQELDLIKRTEVEAAIMRLITSDAISKIIGENHPNNIIRNQGPENLEINDEEELEKPTETPPPGDNPDPLVPSEQNPPQSPVGSRISFVEKDDDPQIKSEEKIKLEHPTKTRPKGPIGRRLPSKWIKGRVQPEQPAKGEQNMQENENSEPTKQPNNRNFRIALATGCALSAIGCLIAGVVTLGMVGAGLLVMSVVFAVAAAVTRYLTPPSSELTSTDLSPLIDDSKQR
ncbi:MAG: hypothetical protein LBJ80_01260 [Rickettsiales bacterium]|jgi:hypothetical protein|nr:hypothetical protein [Rickettsiales bacterium]MDR1261037.1 hypothetical protein [Rickettsiales bacterium]